MRRELRGHPLMILSYLYPYLFLLVLPTVRGLLWFFRTGQAGRLLWGEVLTLTVALAVAVVKWRRFRLILEPDGGLRIRNGVFCLREAVLHRDRVSCVSATRTPLLGALRAVTLRIDTEAGRVGRADFSFLVHTRDYRTVARELPITRRAVTYRAGFSKLVLLSAATSSAVSGILIGVPLLNKSAKLLGVGVERLLLPQLNQINEWGDELGIFRFVPPAVNAVTLLLVGAYLLSFVCTLARNLRFRIRLNREEIAIRTGLFSRRETVFRKAAVNNVTLLQTPFLRLLRHRMLRVSIAGCGEKKQESAVLLPAARDDVIRTQMAAIFGFRPARDPAVRPPQRLRWRFWRWPVLGFTLAPLLTLLACRLFPVFSSLFLFALPAALLFLLYAVSLARYNGRRSGLTLDAALFSARTSRRFSIVELHCPPEHLGVWRIRTLPVDRRLGCCRVKVTVRSQSAESVTLRHLDAPALAKLLSNCYFYPLPPDSFSFPDRPGA